MMHEAGGNKQTETAQRDDKVESMTNDSPPTATFSGKWLGNEKGIEKDRRETGRAQADEEGRIIERCVRARKRGRTYAHSGQCTSSTKS